MSDYSITYKYGQICSDEHVLRIILTELIGLVTQAVWP